MIILPPDQGAPSYRLGTRRVLFVGDSMNGRDRTDRGRRVTRHD